MQSLKHYVLFLLMAVFVAWVAIAPAHAQANGVAVDVPFDFSVGAKLLKAGSYRIETTGAQNSFIALSQIGGSTTYTLFNQRGSAADRNGQAYLVFVRHGAESFLTRVVFSSDEAYTLPLSGREREIVARAGTVEQLDVSAGSAGSR